MLGAGALLEFVKAERAARVHILDTAPDAFEHAGFFGDLAKLLVGAGILAARTRCRQA